MGYVDPKEQQGSTTAAAAASGTSSVRGSGGASVSANSSISPGGADDALSIGSSSLSKGDENSGVSGNVGPHNDDDSTLNVGPSKANVKEGKATKGTGALEAVSTGTKTTSKAASAVGKAGRKSPPTSYFAPSIDVDVAVKEDDNGEGLGEPSTSPAIDGGKDTGFVLSPELNKLGKSPNPTKGNEEAENNKLFQLSDSELDESGASSVTGMSASLSMPSKMG